MKRKLVSTIMLYQDITCLDERVGVGAMPSTIREHVEAMHNALFPAIAWPPSIIFWLLTETAGPDRWFTLTHLDGSVVEFVQFTQKAGFDGTRAAWPWPSSEAWGIIAAFGALQAVLQLGLPGAEHKGPVSPKGNVPVYKVTTYGAHNFSRSRSTWQCPSP